MPSTYIYGLLLSVAFVLGLGLFWHNRGKAGFSPDHFVDLSLLLVFGAIIGARILYILLYPQQFSTLYDYLALHEGGLVFYGGFIGALLLLIIYGRRHRLDLWQLGACLAPSLAIGQAIGRLGCFTNNCCYGKISESCHFYHLPGDPANVFRHPTQLYESAWLLILSLVLQWQLQRQVRSPDPDYAKVVNIYILAYTFFRFLIEFIRGDDRGGFFTGLNLSISQLISLTLFFLLLFLRKSRRRKFREKLHEQSN